MSDSGIHEDVRERVVQLLVNWAGTDPRASLDRPVLLEDFGIDSLGHFNFLMALEEKMGFEFPTELFTLANLGTLDGIIDVVCSQLDRGAPA